MLNHKIVEIISHELRLPHHQVGNTVYLLQDDNSIPFISRYRKEMTGNLDETQVQAIDGRLNYYVELQKRKASILKTIEAQGALTDELSQQINDCWDATKLEDLYLPFKPKRRTRAQAARERGLEPLAKLIMAQKCADIRQRAGQWVDGEAVKSVDEAIAGAQDIIAEWVSENRTVRNMVRNLFRRGAVVRSHFVPGKEIEGRNYENYYDFAAPLHRISSHQLLAMRRGEKEGYLKVSIDIDNTKAVHSIENHVSRGTGECTTLVRAAATDAFKRLLLPSIENEFAAMSKEKADGEAIRNFATNVRQLLFAPPLGRKRVMAIDPGFRTGCKVVCLDEQGNLLCHDVIYPTAPNNDVEGATATLTAMAQKHRVQAISLGNGTASRETERFLKKVRFATPVEVHVVSENGASIYSASAIARDEFPNEDVTVRGAVSIGRRLLDPLAELVKIDPKSIGVGQYQHDVDQKRLKEALDFTVDSCVNSVGVDVNTASKQLLTHVSGLGPQLAQNIVDYRAANGAFTSRQELLKVPKLGPKTFEQAAGFLRVSVSDNPLDNSAVHPERYALVQQMAADCQCSVEELIHNKEKRDAIDINRYVTDEVGRPTLVDIMQELEKPGRDPRRGATEVEFDDAVNDIEDLAVGMELNGIVTNVTDFGAFVNIGVHKDGLVHVSQLADRRVPNPSSVVKVNQPVRVRVLSIDLERQRIALTMRKQQPKEQPKQQKKNEA